MANNYPSTSQEHSNKNKSLSTRDGEVKSRRKKICNEHQCEDVNFNSKFYPKGGLVHSFHGDIYQLKVQMLFLMRALAKGYSFQLGTEVEWAEKFDDIVFRYKVKEDPGYIMRAVQVKHKQDETRRITVADLASNIDSKDDDYSLQKYLVSYLKMKHKTGILKDVTLYTNIDFDLDNLKKTSINIADFKEYDEILNVTKFDKVTTRFTKISVPKTHKLYEKLRETSDLHSLAKKLIKVLRNNGILKLADIFEYYHYVLTEKVFDIEVSGEPIARFRHDFVTGENLSENIRNFRKTLQACLKLEDNQVQSEMRKIKFRASKNFAKKYFYPCPIITESNAVAKIIANIIKKSRKDEAKVITLRKTKGVMAANINKFAFHILVRHTAESGLVRFSNGFFDKNKRLKGNLDEFRTHFQSVLQENGIALTELKQYKFKINDFLTCEESAEGLLKYPAMELSESLVKEEEIDDFLRKLVFAVNQPNELKLGDIITDEMGRFRQFNLLDANLVSSAFQKVMLDWFKRKEGVWLDAESGQDFLDSIGQKIANLICIGISVAYPEKLKSYCIELNENEISKKLNMFLSEKNTSKKVLHIISPKASILSAINVYGTLKVLKQQKKHTRLKQKDSYIFMELKTLLREQIGKYVMNAFDSELNYDLLIIDCTSSVLLRDIDIRLIHSKISETLSRSNKKVIFIATEHNILVDKFVENIKTKKPDNLTFGDLTEKSKQILLKKEVLFQGQSVCLNELIDGSDAKTNELIDIELINNLLKDKEVKIGEKLEGLREIDDYYVHRKFRPTVFSKENLRHYLENGIKSDLFIVCGADMGLKHDNIYKCNNPQAAEKKFSELRQSHADSYIHWLEGHSEHLVWHKSYGSISNLLDHKIHNQIYRTENLSYQYSIEECKLIEETSRRNKIVIISDTAGMGKSTVLTHLSMELKKDSSLWVRRINLNDHNRIFDKEMRNRRTGLKNENKIEVICTEILASQYQSRLEEKWFEHCLKNHGKIVLLFDGFDEISSMYKNIVIDLLQSLQNLHVKNIYVTTRLNLKDCLERELGVFSYYLEPFSSEDQIDFLSKFWVKKLKLENLDEILANKLKIYVNSTIDKISHYFKDKEQEFVSIPLQLMMLAEVFQENKKEQPSDWQSCKEFIESELEIPKLPEDFTLVKLYEQFVETKFYDIYLMVKRGRDFTRQGERPSADNDFKIFKEDAGLLALKLLFRNQLKELLSNVESSRLNILVEAFKTGDYEYHNNGIVDEIVNGQPRFIHRTFAEYFASFVVGKKMIEAPFNTLRCIDDELLKMSPIFMDNLIEQLDGHIEKITSVLKEPLINYIITNPSCSNFVRVLLRCDHRKWHKKLDVFGKSPLHYAAGHGFAKFVNILIDYISSIYNERNHNRKALQYVDSSLLQFLDLQDNDCKTAWHYAVQEKYFVMAFKKRFDCTITSSSRDIVDAIHDYYFKVVVEPRVEDFSGDLAHKFPPTAFLINLETNEIL